MTNTKTSREPRTADVMRPWTEAQVRAMKYIKENGGTAVPGANVDKRGCLIRIPPTVLMALEKRGLVRFQLSPEGGMMAVLVPQPPPAAETPLQAAERLKTSK